jgi:L-ascorbate metabolism protein UlaG (beta-lactamase superfamily)
VLHEGSQRATAEITWIGHSTVLIQDGETRILTDPVLRNRTGHLRRRRSIGSRVGLDGLDCVLISHLHHDHCDLPTLRQLGQQLPLLVPVGTGKWLRRRGFSQVEELPVGSAVQVGRVSVLAVPAEHSGRRVPFGPAAESIGFVVRGVSQIYFAGDTDLFPGMAEVGTGLDCALLPIWGWGRSLGPGHLDPLRAAEAVRLLKPRAVVPIHWGTFYPLGIPPWARRFLDEPAEIFEREARRVAANVTTRIIRPGETIDIPPGGTGNR